MSNTDNCNTGNYNTGDYNTGNYNTGYRNTGHCNTGNYNTGYRNTGNCNTGDWNTGNQNTGHCNTGNRNTGDCNTGDYNSGHFNTDEPTIRMFNKDTGKKRDEITIPFINLKLTEWIPLESMSEQEKKDRPTAETAGGYLKTRTYHEAWAEAWGEADEQTKKAFTELPNFDPEIFKEITGINVHSTSVNSIEIEEIIMNGKRYKLIKE